jgi:hypothetical protein
MSPQKAVLLSAVIAWLLIAPPSLAQDPPPTMPCDATCVDPPDGTVTCTTQTVFDCMQCTTWYRFGGVILMESGFDGSWYEWEVCSDGTSKWTGWAGKPCPFC